MNTISHKNLVKILPDGYNINYEVLKKNIIKDIEFRKSVDSLVHIANKNEKLSILDRYLLFILMIISIEILILNYNDQKKVNFSIRSAWLLGTNSLQRKRIQKFMGVSYTLRNSIAHELSIPGNNNDFIKIFHGDFELAYTSLIKIYSMIVWRFVLENSQVLSKNKLLHFFNVQLKNGDFSLPFSFFDNKLNIELSNLLNTPSTIKTDRDYVIKKGTEIENFLIGIDTYGGLTEYVHVLIDEHERFYNRYNRMIPSEEVWKSLKEKIDSVVSEINSKGYKNITIHSKSHITLLFYFGYQLKDYNCNLNMEFNDNFLNFDKIRINQNKTNWNTIKKVIETKSHSISVIISINDDLFRKFSEIQKSTTKNTSILALELEPEIDNSNIKIISEEYLLLSCYNLNDILQDLNGEIKTLNLFIRAPYPMMVILGRLLSKSNFKINLFEYGKKKFKDKFESFHKVISIT